MKHITHALLVDTRQAGYCKLAQRISVSVTESRPWDVITTQPKLKKKVRKCASAFLSREV